MASFNKPDYVEAKKWFELAASNKYAAAYFNLGMLYEVGGRLRVSEFLCKRS